MVLFKLSNDKEEHNHQAQVLLYYDNLFKIHSRDSGQLSIKEPAICALRHLTSRNQQAETARDIVGGSVILSLVKESLQMPQQLNEAHMGYVRGILSLIRNITKSPGKHRQFCIDPLFNTSVFSCP